MNLQSKIAVFLLCVFGLPDCVGWNGTAAAEPSKGGSNGYELQPNAILLDGLPITIVHVDDTTVVIKGRVKGIVPGKILISSEGDGLLRKVIRVAPIRDGLNITTTEASLTEAYFRLNIDMRATVDIKPVPQDPHARSPRAAVRDAP